MHGCLVTILYQGISELLSDIGFDWLLIDIQKNSTDLKQVQMMLQSAGDRCSCIVRIPFMDKVFLKKILDTGIDGIIIPNVSSAEEASQVVSECKYPPQGIRGVGIARAQMYGIKLQEYVAKANERVAVVIQIDETVELNTLKSIIQVQGIDAVILGTENLNHNPSFGVQKKEVAFKKKIIEIQKICKEENTKLGIFGVTPESKEFYLDHGITLMTIGSDVSFLKEESINLLKTIKN